MKPKVLVIGGSYFAGRVFTMVASQECELTLLNRGRYSMTRYPGVTEFRCDRHDAAALAALPPAEYDAVVDFCAYAPGEIESLIASLKASFRKYIFISTADVYDRSAPRPWTEQTPLASDFGGGPEAEYLAGKTALDRECRAVCARRGIDSVILRPAFLYGPYNYAPREPWYIRTAVSGSSMSRIWPRRSSRACVRTPRRVRGHTISPRRRCWTTTAFWRRCAPSRTVRSRPSP